MATDSGASEFDFSRYIGLSSTTEVETNESVVPIHPARVRKSSVNDYTWVPIETPSRSLGKRKLPRRTNTLTRTQTRSQLLDRIDLDRLILETRVGLHSKRSSGVLGDANQLVNIGNNSNPIAGKESQSPGPWSNTPLPARSPRSPAKYHRQNSSPLPKHMMHEHSSLSYGTAFKFPGESTQSQNASDRIPCDNTGMNYADGPTQQCTQMDDMHEQCGQNTDTLTGRLKCDASEQDLSNLGTSHAGLAARSSGIPKEAPPPRNARDTALGDLTSRSNPASECNVSRNDKPMESFRSTEGSNMAVIDVIPEETSRHRSRVVAPVEELRRGPLMGVARRRVQEVTESGQEMLALTRARPKRSSLAAPSDVRVTLLGQSTDVPEVRVGRKRERQNSQCGSTGPPPASRRGTRTGSTIFEPRRWSETAVAPTPRKENVRRGTWTYDNDIRLSKFTRDGEAVFHFRKSARKIMIVLQWMKVISKQDERIETKLKTFFDMAQDLDAAPKKQFTDESGLSFDPRQFRAKKAIHVTSDQKRVLTLHNDFRTSEMIQKVLTGLQHLEAFAEYPLHMQEKLAKVAWYQELPSKKLIIRQGHRAESFYFILSGSAIAKQLVRDEATGKVNMRVVGRMQRGESFGEVALVQHSERTATVESATPMQLLVVSREDFMDIFFAHSEGNEPDHITFCKSIEFLKEWPVEKCLQEPRACLFHYFRRGTVIVSDSRKGEWIYIVKTGTCTVLKKLKRVSPQRSSANAKQIDMSMKIPKDGTSCQAPRIDTRLSDSCLRYGSLYAINRPASVLDPLNKELRLPILQGEDNSKAAKSRFRNKLASLLSSRKSTKLPIMSAPARDRMSMKPGAEEQGGHERSHPTQRKRLASLSVKSAKMVRIRDPNHDTAMTPREQAPEKNGMEEEDEEDEGEEEEDDDDEAWLNRSMEMLVNCHGRYSSRQSAGAQDDDPPCFVQLKKLRPRDVFGLEEMMAEEEATIDGSETSVTLVSNGAELVMLSRRFFLKHCNENTRKHLREISRPFPNEDTLQDNLQEKVNWDSYRREMVHDLLTYRTELKVLQLAT